MYRNHTAQQHNFAIVPNSEVPRSKFPMRQTRKQAFNASELVPIMVEEVLPGDTWQHTESIMARLATPIAPAVDDIDLETFYFWVPNRIVDPDWKEFITGSDDTGVIKKLRPVRPGIDNRVEPDSVFDHMGILPQLLTTALPLTAYPIWGYFMIYNEWFRDQNLQDEWEWPTGDSQDTATIVQGATPWDQSCLRANKRHDYFTSSLPWPQKGDAVAIALAGFAPVVAKSTQTGVATDNQIWMQNGSAIAVNANQVVLTGGNDIVLQPASVGSNAIEWHSASNQTGLVANLATASSITINDFRLAVATQRMLEKDARGGSRYVENILTMFGVRVPDYTAQRPEYLGGSKIAVTVNPVAQTAAYDAEPALSESAIGNLGAEMHASGHKRTFSFASTEHGYIIGLAVLRATPTYQQGTRRHWLRDTRLELYWPELANLGEQAVETQEIWQSADGTYDNATWGYQERNAEYRYTPNEITGVLRSTAAQPLDWWHYSEEFGAEPALNAAFITDKTQETLARSLATAPSEQWSAQVIMDIQHDSIVARLMPAYSVPGLKYL